MVFGISNDFIGYLPLALSPSLSYSPFLLFLSPSPLALPGEHAGNRTEIRSSEGAPLEATDEKTASHVATARPHPWTGTRVVWYHQLIQKRRGKAWYIFIT